MKPSPPLLVLLGSGATYPAIPGVSQITAHLMAWNRLRAPDPGILTPLIPTGAADSRLPLFDWLSKTASANRKDPPHFEQLVHVLEQLESLYPLPPSRGTVDKYVPLISTFVEPKAQVNVDGYGFAAQLACKEILNLVAAHCKQVQDKGVHPLAAGLDALAITSRLRVFSLNYDDVPEHGATSYVTGYGPGPTDFNPAYVLDPGPRHLHAQLHGSVLWGDALLGSIPERHADRSAASAGRGTFSSWNTMQDGHRGTSAPMITGLRKADRSLADPYFSYEHALMKHLLGTERWLIIGYGAGDHHINAALRSAREARLRAGKSLRVAAVNFFTDWEIPGPTPAWFGTPAATSVSNQLQSWADDACRAFVAPTSPYIDQHSFNRIAPDIALSLDGTEWALGAGLKELKRWLKLK